ncbi:MAG: HAD family hydrolase [Leptolyngbyaceae cyanobacterium]
MTDLTPQTLESLRSAIATVDCVSFDFFDTLFVRLVAHPEDVFDLLARQLDYPRFKQKRRKAQAAAFEYMLQLGNSEISLADIYHCFAESDAARRTAMMQAESDLEFRLIRPNPEMFSLLKDCLAERRRVAIISDMYLPLSFFMDVLSRYALGAIPLYVSSDRNATKRDKGKLFELLKAEQNLSGHQILHIGDNAQADVQQAVAQGLQAFHYVPPSPRALVGAATVEKSLASGLWRWQSQKTELTPEAELGFLYGGLATVGFGRWIEAQAQRDDVTAVLFLSRDGYVLSRLTQQGNGWISLPTHYFWGSRVAFNLAALMPHTFAELMPFLLSGSEGLQPVELLERIGVTPPEEFVLQDLGLGSGVVIGPENYAAIAAFLGAYRQEILKTAHRSRRALFHYLYQLKLRSGDRVALVDVGWSGTTQEAFETAIADMMDLSVVGYYFCLADTPKRLSLSQSQEMKGFLTSAALSPELIAALYQNRVAIEMMFSAPHHTVIGLESSRQGVQPIYDPGRSAQSDADAWLQVTQEINGGIEAFAAKYWQLNQAVELDRMLPPLELAKPLVELALSQGNDDIGRLQAVKDFDAWGSSRNHTLDLATYRQ